MQPVSREDHEARLRSLAALPGSASANNSDAEGFFGPGSMCWRINRESSVFLGAGRAALLQIAHPWVAVALAQHSTLLQDSVARFHSTFRVVYTMVFGTRAQALAAARGLWHVHSGVTGTLPRSTQPYRANDAEALLWVYATLVESAVLAHECAHGPLSCAEREGYYQESMRIAMLCGVPAAALPADWTRFTAYTRDMLASATLTVDDTAYRLGQSVLHGAGSRVPIPRWYRELTAAWLPPRLRMAFGLPWGPAQQRRAHAAAAWAGRVYPWLPRAARYVGPFHEAVARLEGRHVGTLTRRNTRLWTGRDTLLAPPERSAP